MTTSLAAALHQTWNWASIPFAKIAPGIERQLIYGERLMLCRHGATILDEETIPIDIFSPIREDLLQAPAAEPAR